MNEFTLQSTINNVSPFHSFDCRGNKHLGSFNLPCKLSTQIHIKVLVYLFSWCTFYIPDVNPLSNISLVFFFPNLWNSSPNWQFLPLGKKKLYNFSSHLSVVDLVFWLDWILFRKFLLRLQCFFNTPYIFFCHFLSFRCHIECLNLSGVRFHVRQKIKIKFNYSKLKIRFSSH